MRQTMDETREIPGFPGYSITKDGRVFSLKRGSLREIVGSVNFYGYRKVALRRNGKTAQKLVHRLVLEVFIGLCPSGMECRHINGDKLDNRLENLSWGTRSENEADKIRLGNHNRGVRHWRSKLTEDDVMEILSNTTEQKTIAETYGVSPSTISKIRTRQIWRWLNV